MISLIQLEISIFCYNLEYLIQSELSQIELEKFITNLVIHLTHLNEFELSLILFVIS